MRKIEIIICICLLITSCGIKHEEKEDKIIFTVTSPLKKDTLIIKNYVSQVRAFNHIDLKALEKGYLDKIYVSEGQLVRKGQAMFKIKASLYEAELSKAKAELDFASIEYKNTKSLAESGVVSENDLAMVKAKLEKSRAELQLAQVHLNFTQINAPFDGIVDRFQVRQGSLLEEGTMLTTLSDNSQMWVYFNVPEAEYLDLKMNKVLDKDRMVSLLMVNNQIFKHKGLLNTIEADFNNETGNIAFRATFPNPERLLRHGETGNIQISYPLKGAIIIPQKATFEILEKKYVFVIDKDKVVRLREIIIDSELSGLFIIKEGLSISDKILLEGIRKVRDGQKIDFKYINPQEIISNLKVYVE
ncbi:MAG: efflux RND transporter periplasmic adaptor subunit [Cytophagales bacterium]|nr:MAG: efflux RND transporter periplasmic adaptor subunit [Cytophagales bacterium]